MNYKSTRNSEMRLESAQAIVQGLSCEGGLFVPQELPKISLKDIERLCDKSYKERAFEIFKLFLTDFTDEEIKACITKAYGDNFDTQSIAEIAHLLEGTYILELWHGPTCAFKDMALQILPHLLMTSAKKTIPNKKIAILAATSGDTGKAALEGFKDVEGTSVSVFYPVEGVSDMQKRQMVTQEGENVFVCAVKGNFDDCQNGVKAIFTDEKLSKELENIGIVLSSANSINWGRLSPQIVYYVWAYSELVKNEEIKLGEKINIVVPTGNFGNILAAYYAKEMGVPIAKLICASNSNHILTDFIKTGVYDRNREFYQTSSPSMDILISSNLERLLYHLSGDNDKLINEWFASLKNTGRYEVNEEVKQKLSSLFYAGWSSDEETERAIGECFNDYSYLMDTHTAVAYKVYGDYKKDTGDKAKTLIASTASPYKFGAAVYRAVGGSDVALDNADEFIILEKLSEKTNTEIPAALAETKNKKIRFEGSADKEAMPKAVLEFLKK